MLERKRRHIEEGRITIGIHDRKTYNKVENEIRKTNELAQNSGAEIAQINKVTKKIKLVKGHPKRIGTRREDPIAHVMKQCDGVARKKRE